MFVNYENIFFKGVVFIVELLLLNLLLTILLHFFGSSVDPYLERHMLYALATLAYAVSFSQHGTIFDKPSAVIEGIMSKVFRTVFLFSLILIVAFILADVIFSVRFFALFFTLLFVVVFMWRFLSRNIYRYWRHLPRNCSNVIILGAGHVGAEVYDVLKNNKIQGYNVLGIYDDRDEADYEVDKTLVKGSLSDALTLIKSGTVNEVISALPAVDDKKSVDILQEAERCFVKSLIVPDFQRYIKKGVSLVSVANIPMILFRDEPLEEPWNRLAKRIFDILFSALVLVVFSPIYIMVAIAVKFSSPGPIFFKQKRTGKNGRDFYCLKFRTMKVNAEADHLQATKGDSRITKVGSVLRKTNLDEMPQFVNVLFGDMSVVGPRPHMVSQTEQYSKLIDEYMVRHLAKPGITGWAQVTGFRGETSDISQMIGRVKQDVWYIENWSFWLDIRIIFQTVFNMIKGDKAAY
ncbi:MAG: undecaprenyl-phosphate glucose phosphotransferase [Paludibacteraceae bacterium]|nr:undecaprenyl-phosphate glucose phosphotransferase [Paludibacteraceae bacterium]